MSVGWQPDIITLSEQINRYDTLLGAIHSQLKNMARVTAEVAERVGIPFQKFLVEQRLEQAAGRQEASRSRSRSRWKKEKRRRSIQRKE